MLFYISLFFSLWASEHCTLLFETQNSLIERLQQEVDFKPRLLRKKQVEIPEITYSNELVHSKAYNELLENSIELVLTPGSTDYGHIYLRIGKELFDFADVKHGLIAGKFQGHRFKAFPDGERSTKGVVFYVPKETIAKKREEILRFYQSMKKNNIPAFHGNGDKLYLTKKARFPLFKNWFQVDAYSSEGKFGNNAAFRGEVVEREVNGRIKYFLVSENGVEQVLSVSRDGRKYVKGLSCASSATCIAREYLGLDIPDFVSARNLVNQMSWGNNKGKSTPVAIIIYHHKTASN